MENNYRLSKIFSYLYTTCLLRGNPKRRCSVYKHLSKVLLGLPEDVSELYGELEELLNVDRSFLLKIKEFLETGRLREYEEALSEFGDTPDFINVRGIGVSTAQHLFRLGIKTYDDLLKFLESGKAGDVFKSPERVYGSVKFYLLQRELFTFPEARLVVKAFLKEYPSAIAAGEYRRGEPIVSRFDFLLSEEDAFRLAISGRYRDGWWMWADERIPIHVHIYTPDDLGSVLLYATGPEAHVRALGELVDIKGESEEDIYARAGLPYVHPYQRFDGGEIALAARGELPPPLLPENVPGDMHVHTTYSDGSMTAEEAVQAAIKRGYTAIALADHSPSSKAGGLNLVRLERKFYEILKLREKYPYVRILFATEVDILPDGSLDYPDEVLKVFDLVIASVHSWGEDEDITARILKALENPFVDAIGHPTGRVLKKRPSYRVNLEKVMRMAEETGKALEINANPKRVDLDAYALLEGGYRGKVILGTDAHREWDMDYMFLGCAQVSRARIPRERVRNLDIAEEKTSTR